MSNFFIDVHKTISNMINIYPLIVGVWGIFNWIRKQPPDGNFNGAVAIGAGLFAVQLVVGLLMVLFGAPAPPRSIHFLYGVTIVLTIPAIFTFTRGRNSTRESLLYGLGMLFIWGLAERAVATGTGAG